MSSENQTNTESIQKEIKSLVYQPKYLSVNGRIGRLRYIAYVTGTQLLILMLFVLFGGAVSFIGNSSSDVLATLIGFAIIMLYGTTIVLSLTFGKRRLNDLNKSGWTVLLLLIPILNLIVIFIMLFIKGSDGPNRFGPVPTVNSTGVTIFSLFVPFVILLGFAVRILPEL